MGPDVTILVSTTVAWGSLSLSNEASRARGGETACRGVLVGGRRRQGSPRIFERGCVNAAGGRAQRGAEEELSLATPGVIVSAPPPSTHSKRRCRMRVGGSRTGAPKRRDVPRTISLIAALIGCG